jgi:hypothetical protein
MSSLLPCIELRVAAMCDLSFCRVEGRHTGGSYSLTRSAAIHSTTTHLFFPFPMSVTIAAPGLLRVLHGAVEMPIFLFPPSSFPSRSGRYSPRAGFDQQHQKSLILIAGNTINALL